MNMFMIVTRRGLERDQFTQVMKRVFNVDNIQDWCYED